MVLAPADRAAVLALWRKLGTNVGIYTTEALERCAQVLAPQGSPVFSALGGCVPRRPIPEPFLPRPRHQDAPHSPFLPQDLRGLPFLQDLFPPPKLEPRLRPGRSPRPEGGRRAELGREPPGRPAGHPVVPARAAHAQAARGPGLFQGELAGGADAHCRGRGLSPGKGWCTAWEPFCLQLLCHCLLVTLARHYPGDFSPNMHASLVKFLNHVISALAPSSG